MGVLNLRVGRDFILTRRTQKTEHHCINNTFCVCFRTIQPQKLSHKYAPNQAVQVTKQHYPKNACNLNIILTRPNDFAKNRCIFKRRLFARCVYLKSSTIDWLEFQFAFVRRAVAELEVLKSLELGEEKGFLLKGENFSFCQAKA